MSALQLPEIDSELTGQLTLQCQLVERILASEQFVRAPRLQRFLRYITDRTLEGKLDEITEVQIGVNVFDKPGSYNPGDDNVVRTYARTLRKKLAEYFAGEGAHESIVLEVPRGAYIPMFRMRTGADLPHGPSAVAEAEADPTFDGSSRTPGAAAQDSNRKTERYPSMWFAFAIVCLLGVTCGLVGFRFGRTSAEKLPMRQASSRQ